MRSLLAQCDSAAVCLRAAARGVRERHAILRKLVAAIAAVCCSRIFVMLAALCRSVAMRAPAFLIYRGERMASLQEQFLKAGLVDKTKVKLANQDKSKQKKVERRTGTTAVDEVHLAALETQRKNAERARELNAQRDAAATQKAIAAQIVQMVQKNRQSKGAGDIAYNFTHNSKIERIHVSAAVQAYLVAGQLVIICLDGKVELVPRIIADKIAERDASIVVRVNKTSNEVDADDPYAAYKIPDDLMW
jgi:uncharacterized protein YaiL (DUF2058 family)